MEFLSPALNLDLAVGQKSDILKPGKISQTEDNANSYAPNVSGILIVLVQFRHEEWDWLGLG